MISWRNALCAGALFLIAMHNVAQAADPVAPPETVDLAAVLKLVREASPRLAAERESIVQAQADRITASAYPNPSVSYNRSRPSGGIPATVFTGTREETASIEQPLLFPGLLSARIGKADRSVEAARARVDAGAGTLAAEAGTAYINLLAAQEKATLAVSANDELKRLRQIVASRQSGGLASQYDLTRLDVELAGSTSKQEETQADVAEASGALAALVGLKNWQPRASGMLSPDLLGADIPSGSPRDLATGSPAVVAASREEQAAQAGVVVARRERWPNLSVVLGRDWTTHPFGASDFFGLTVEVPIFDTRRGPLAKAESEAHEALLRRDLATAETAANLDSLSKAIATREAALKRFDADAAARLPSLKQMAEDNYRLRAGSILELLDATRSRYELQETRVDLVARLMNSQLTFLAISGTLERSASLRR